jgi:hypothetical protein
LRSDRWAIGFDRGIAARAAGWPASPLDPFGFGGDDLLDAALSLRFRTAAAMSPSLSPTPARPTPCLR